MRTSRRLRWVTALLSAGLALSACRGHRAAGGSDLVAVQIAQGEAALQGTWLLVEAQPNPPLDPVLGSLLGAQLGQMRVTFQNGLLTAQGVGIQVTRRYRVVGMDPSGVIHVSIRDELGTESQTEGTIEGDTMRFTGRTPPWMGTGELRKVAP